MPPSWSSCPPGRWRRSSRRCKRSAASSSSPLLPLWLRSVICAALKIPGNYAAGARGGIQGQTLGRSRGGFSTNIHLRVNADGLPIGLVLTPGEAHDTTAYSDLMDERDSDPAILLADRGYDRDAIRHHARERGAKAEIPTKRNRKVQHSVRRRLYALRSRIGCFINVLKNNRRVATCYDHTASSFLGFVLLACIRAWIGHLGLA